MMPRANSASGSWSTIGRVPLYRIQPMNPRIAMMRIALQVVELVMKRLRSPGGPGAGGGGGGGGGGGTGGVMAIGLSPLAQVVSYRHPQNPLAYPGYSQQ